MIVYDRHTGFDAVRYIFITYAFYGKVESWNNKQLETVFTQLNCFSLTNTEHTFVVKALFYYYSVVLDNNFKKSTCVITWHLTEPLSNSKSRSVSTWQTGKGNSDFYDRVGMCEISLNHKGTWCKRGMIHMILRWKLTEAVQKVPEMFRIKPRLFNGKAIYMLHKNKYRTFNREEYISFKQYLLLPLDAWK